MRPWLHGAACPVFREAPGWRRRQRQRHRRAAGIQDQRLAGVPHGQKRECGQTLLAGPLFRSLSSPLSCRQAARLVYEMRHKWQNLFLKRMRFPSKPWSQQDEAVVHAVVSVRARFRRASRRPAGSLFTRLLPPTGCGRSLQQKSTLQACSSLRALASGPGPWQRRKSVLPHRAAPVHLLLPRTAHRCVTGITRSPALSRPDRTKDPTAGILFPAPLFACECVNGN